MRFSFLYTILLAALVLTSCENTFEPKAEFREELVVFAIFSKTQPKQIIRLESTYDAEFTNPDQPLNKRIIDEANVFVSDGRREYKFERETVMLQDGTDRHLWTNSEIIPTAGSNYRMRVVMNGETVATADMQIPSRPFMTMTSRTFGDGSGGIRVAAGGVSSSATPKGFYFRLWVMGEIVEGQDTTRYYEEVPYLFNADKNEYVLPTPTRVTEILFSVDYVIRAKNILQNTHQEPLNYWLVATGSAMDANFYNYYKVVRGFDDPVSVRQDLPNITNINGGLGVFGGITVDSLSFPYTSFVRQ